MHQVHSGFASWLLVVSGFGKDAVVIAWFFAAEGTNYALVLEGQDPAFMPHLYFYYKKILYRPLSFRWPRSIWLFLACL